MSTRVEVVKKNHFNIFLFSIHNLPKLNKNIVINIHSKIYMRQRPVHIVEVNFYIHFFSWRCNCEKVTKRQFNFIKSLKHVCKFKINYLF